jgi:hypothetical protein
MKNTDTTEKTKLDEYIELSKHSLIRMQYSCSGNSDFIGDVTSITNEESTTKQIKNEE